MVRITREDFTFGFLFSLAPRGVDPGLLAPVFSRTLSGSFNCSAKWAPRVATPGSVCGGCEPPPWLPGTAWSWSWSLSRAVVVLVGCACWQSHSACDNDVLDDNTDQPAVQTKRKCCFTSTETLGLLGTAVQSKWIRSGP